MWFLLLGAFIIAMLKLIYPKEMFMLVRRCGFKARLEPNDAAADMARVSSIIIIVLILVFVVSY